jgi:hypothetical protein
MLFITVIIFLRKCHGRHSSANNQIHRRTARQRPPGLSEVPFGTADAAHCALAVDAAFPGQHEHGLRSMRPSILVLALRSD